MDLDHQPVNREGNSMAMDLLSVLVKTGLHLGCHSMAVTHNTEKDWPEVDVEMDVEVAVVVEVEVKVETKVNVDT